MPLSPGTRLGPYEIVAPLGAGGMGEVWRARDSRLGREVAVKVLPPEFAADPERLKRFEREARATAALSHPNILAVHDVGTHEGVPYLVEELLEGESLRERLDRGGLTLSEAMRIAGEIAKGLAAAHEKGIVHRDLKPGNVFLTRDGTVKVLDFGLAKLLPTEPADEAETLTAATATTRLGGVLGTAAYMAPEQARGRPVDQRADVFAFGVVLYEMLAGERPFRGATGTEVMAAILTDEPAPLPAGVPPGVAAVVGRCLEKDPDRRYQRGSELRAALEAVQSGSAAVSRPSWLAARPRWVFAAVMLVAAIAAVLALDPKSLRSRMIGQGAAPRIASLAVLPLENLSGDPEQEYLADGMHEALITDLAQLSGLERVIARSSAMRYKGSTAPPGQIAKELKVAALVTGAVQRAGDRVRVTAHLIDPATESELWGHSFERSLQDVLSLQDEIVSAITSEIGLQLTAHETTRLSSARRVDPEVYEAYLRGSYHWQKMTPSDVDTAEKYFELAAAKDPSYAPIHEGMAWVWAVRQQLGWVSASAAGPEAKAAAQRAIALDERSGEAHEALALVLMVTDWDWQGSEAEWQKALEINPNNANAHAYYAHLLLALDRVGSAMEHSRRSLELDPFNPLFHGMYGMVLLSARRFDEAIEEARTALTMQPSLVAARSVLWNALVHTGRREEALDAQREWIAQDPERLAAFDRGRAEAGFEGALRELCEVLIARYRSGRYFGAHGIAFNLLAAGDSERSLEWLEEGYRIRDPGLLYFSNPTWDPLRSDPRFRALLRRIGLPED